jgi:hypothetical protein
MAPQGSGSSMRLLGQVGSFSKVSFNQFRRIETVELGGAQQGLNGNPPEK